MKLNEKLIEKLFSLPTTVINLNKTRVKEVFSFIEQRIDPIDKNTLMNYLENVPEFKNNVVSINRYILNEDFRSKHFDIKVFFDIKYVLENTDELFYNNEKVLKNKHLHVTNGELNTFQIGIKTNGEIYNFATVKILKEEVNKNIMINKLIHMDCAKNQLLTLSRYAENYVIFIF